jgi:hypothetical protein
VTFHIFDRKIKENIRMGIFDKNTRKSERNPDSHQKCLKCGNELTVIEKSSSGIGGFMVGGDLGSFLGDISQGYACRNCGSAYCYKCLVLGRDKDPAWRAKGVSSCLQCLGVEFDKMVLKTG